MFHWGSYMNQLSTIANIDPIREVTERMFLYAMVLVLVEGLSDARRVNFKLNVDRTNFSVSPSSVMVNIVYWILIIFMKIGILQ